MKLIHGSDWSDTVRGWDFGFEIIFGLHFYLWSGTMSEIRFGRIIDRDFKNDVNSKLTISD